MLQPTAASCELLCTLDQAFMWAPPLCMPAAGTSPPPHHLLWCCRTAPAGQHTGQVNVSSSGAGAPFGRLPRNGTAHIVLMSSCTHIHAHPRHSGQQPRACIRGHSQHIHAATKGYVRLQSATHLAAAVALDAPPVEWQACAGGIRRHQLVANLRGRGET